MKYLIVDDHAVVREGVAAVLRAAEPQGVILQAQDCASALAMAAAHPDIAMVLMDLVMPDAVGLSAVEAFVAAYPDLPVMVISSSEAPADVRQALALGALGYAPKSANATTLLAAIRLVQSGEVYVPPFVVKDIAAAPAAAAAPSGNLAALTERQREVLDLICAEASNKDIAHALGVTEGTVKAHITVIFKLLGVVTRAQAARLAQAPRT